MAVLLILTLTLLFCTGQEGALTLVVSSKVRGLDNDTVRCTYTLLVCKPRFHVLEMHGTMCDGFGSCSA